jgi:hypothetical protein
MNRKETSREPRFIDQKKDQSYIGNRPQNTSQNHRDDKNFNNSFG